jgi:hypothetical protein
MENREARLYIHMQCGVGDHALGAIGGRGVKHGLASLGLLTPGTAVFSSF